MKKLFNFMIAALAVVGVACTPNNEDDADNNVPLTLKIEISYLTSNSANVQVYPSNYHDDFYFDVVEKAVYDQYESDEAFINHVVADLVAKYGKDISEADRFTNEGWGYEEVLTPSTNYYVYAFGVTKEGVVTTGLTKYAFRTLAASEGGNKVIDGLVWGRFSDYGDYYNVGAKNWVVVLYDELRTSEFNIELQTELSATDLTVGEYPITSTLAAGTAIAGADDEGYYGTFWKNSVETAFCKSGTVVLGKEGDNYTISVNALDDQGNTVTASYAGELEKIVYDF
jgi:hypothetical protein